MSDGQALVALDAAQRAHLLGVAAAVIREVICRNATSTGITVDPAIAYLPVDGIFASLHVGDAGRELRACCGHLGGVKPLGKTLLQAAAAACRDRRFPPLRETELDDLTLELSLLYDWTVVARPPADRPAAIVVGEHGLMLKQGFAAGGLLLPVVGREHGWTAVQFLDATCRKAGLAAGAWREPTVQLDTFRAVELAGRFGACRV
jgi:hypothetical protein